MNRVVHFEIQADDISRAQEFYKKVFGWKTEQVMTKEKGGMDYWGITTGEKGGGINGGLYKRPAEKGEQQYLYDCTIDVADIDKAVGDIKNAGGTIVKEKMEIPGVGWFASAKDPEGNRFGLIQPTGWQPE